MKTWKRALALVLALVMALSLVALPSFAEGEETGGGTAATQPVWPAEGSIKLDKDAKAVKGQENLWEVTLGIQGKNFKTNSDVVLVIDCSGSMEGTKLANTQKAAKAFGDKLLTENSTTRIAIVTFIDKAKAYNNGHFYTASELSAFKSAVDAATYANGGTNQQAGIHVAQQLLDSSPAGNLKNIVILSDGEPTYSYPFVATATYEGCSRRYDWGCGEFGPTGGRITNIGTTFTPDYNTVIGSGGAFTTSYNAYVNATCTEHGTTSRLSYGVYALDGTVTRTSGTNNGVATIWEANQAKAAGTTIFSVALQAGTDGENTLKSCASDAAKGYFAIGQNDNNVETKLKDAFEAIAGSIAIAASNGSVADTMGEKVQLSFSGTAPVITTDKAVYDAGKADVYISQGSATYDAVARRINWTVGSVREGDNPIMKYKVTVKEGYSPSTNEVLDANKEATFSYKNYLGEDTVGTFPVPQVTVGGGNILVHYYLVNDQGKPINENGAVVESPALAKQVKIAAYHEENGKTGLEYNKPYTVSYEKVDDYNYFGSYILNDGTLTKGDSVNVTLTAANSNQHVWFAYYQTFNVAHVQMDENGAAKTVNTHTYPVSAEFNLTDKVTNGYLYGGAFFDKDCTTAYPFTNEGETGLSFAPQAGATYYIWEVPNTYLIPKVLYGNGHYEDTGYQMDVVGLYMVSAIDRSNYAEVGFYLDDVRTKAAQTTYTDIVDNREETKIVTVSGSVAFSNVSITKKDTTTDVYTASSLVPADKYGYMLCYGVSKESKWQTAGESFTYYPYWVTLDGVEVTNGTTRTVTYNGPGNSQPSVSDSYDRAAECKTPAANASAQLLLMDSYCADGTPIAADTPAVENVTVTVVDAAKTYELTVSAGTGIRDQVAYQAPAGKVFAGWFADQAYTTPADLDQVTQDTTIYAKYVSDSYLDLDYSRTGLFRLRGVTLISAVDNPANYQASGFIVGDQKVDVSYASRYRIFKTPANLFGAARDAKLMLADKSLSGTGTLEATPYWVTLDGTEVHGVTHTLHYNTRTIWE
jgi:hypothetical protein